MNGAQRMPATVQSQSQDAFELLLHEIEKVAWDMILSRASFDRPHLCVCEWSTTWQSTDSGEVVAETFADAAILGLLALMKAKKDPAAVTIPDREDVVSSELYAMFEAIERFATAHVQLRRIGKTWKLDWESQDKEIRVDRKGEIGREDVRQAIEEAFARTAARVMGAVQPAGGLLRLAETAPDA